MSDIIIKTLQSEREKTRKICEQLIEAEQSYLYTTDGDYLTNLAAFFPKKNEKDNNDKKIFLDSPRFLCDPAGILYSKKKRNFRRIRYV